MAAKPPGKTKAEALDKGLRGMFKRLEARPLPEHITHVVEQLDSAGQAPQKKRSAG